MGIRIEPAPRRSASSQWPSQGTSWIPLPYIVNIATPASQPGWPKAFRERTCADWLSVVEPHLGESLVAPGVLRQLRAVARRLPGDCLTALEARLASHSDRVDLSFRQTDPSSAPVLAQRFASARLDSFLTRWSQRDSGLEPVSSVWLELDLVDESHGLPEPVTCVELRGHVTTDWLLDSLVPALDGRPPSATRRRLLRRCLEAMPAPGELLYVFALGARSLEATRLEFHRIEPAAMVTYLEAVAPAEVARRVAELQPLIADCDRYHLSLDIGEDIAPRVGIESSFRRLPQREPGWGRLADRLVERGLCTPEKRAALFAWPGWDSPRTAPDTWPAALRRHGTFCARCLSHFKLTSRPDREPEAKAYLLFEPLDKTLSSNHH